MRKARILLFLGVWVAILPYLGFPYSWKDVLTTFSGLGFIGFSYLLYLEHKETNTETFENFSENQGFDEETNKPNS